jgi:glycosyltransferase involved in cell wall biosynthesis
LHIDPDDMDNPMSGGGPIRTYEIYKRLVKRHEITVLTPTFPGSTPELIRNGIRYIRVGRRIGDHGSTHHLTFLAGLPKAIKNFDYDLLVEDFMPPMSVTFNPFWNKKPLIASVQWFHADLISKQLKFPFHLLERYGLRWYDNFVVLTDSMKKRIVEIHPKARCEIIPNAVDDRLFDQNSTFGDFILYIGSMDFSIKGVDLLLCAYAKIPESERLPLKLAGHGFNDISVNELVSSLGLQKWISILGKVDHKQRNELLSTCRFVCVPSRRETFGMVILEACASAKPVIIFDHPPMNEVAPGNACVFVEPFNVEKYAEAMLKMIQTSSKHMSSNGEKCRQWAMQYNWDDIANHQESFYEQVLSDAR